VPTAVDHHFNPPVALTRCDVDARAHGAAGDGATDDTAAIQKAIGLTPAGGTLCVPDGTYMIDAARSLVLKSAFRLKLAPGTTLRARPNNLGGYAVVRAVDKTDIVIEGGVIQGERMQHQGTTGEWGMGIDIRGSRGVTIRRVQVRDCWGDGIYLGRGKTSITNEDIDIVDVVARNNRRQGISIITGRRVAVVRARLAETAGTPPAAGLDIEPNAVDEPIEDIQILDLTTERNAGGGLAIQLGSGPRSASAITVHRHTDIGSAHPLVLYATYPGTLQIRGTDWRGGAPAVIKRNCAFRLSATELFPPPPASLLTSCTR
jgi:hypothetical protein